MERCGGSHFAIYKSIHSLQFMRLSWNSIGWYETSIRTIPQSWIFDFFPGDRISSIHPIELKLGSMILDISPRNVDISPHNSVGARLLQSLNRFTACRSYAFELKLCWMIRDISPHDSSASDFSNHTSVRCEARLLKFSYRLTSYSIDPIELELGMIILDINQHKLYEQNI